MAKIKLTPGVRYLARDGRVSSPVRAQASQYYPFSAQLQTLDSEFSFAENGFLFLDDPTEADLIESLPTRILRILLSSTLSGYVDASTGLPYPLVDALSDENGTIDSGETRLRELAAKLAEEIFLSEAEAAEALAPIEEDPPHGGD